MAIALQSLTSPSRKRVRLQFSNSLAGGAFDAAKYRVVSTDGLGGDPSVIRVLVVGDSPGSAELVLSTDLVDGAGYDVTALTGIPATDASSTLTDTTLPLRVAGANPIRKRSKQAEAFDELFGTDIDYNNGWQETPDGDLAIIIGFANASSAIGRRVKSEGLPWDPEYGRIAREYVDGPSPSVAELRSELAAQAQKDDRVKDASAIIVSSEALESGEVLLELQAQLIGKLSVTVPVPIKVS